MCYKRKRKDSKNILTNAKFYVLTNKKLKVWDYKVSVKSHLIPIRRGKKH